MKLVGNGLQLDAKRLSNEKCFRGKLFSEFFFFSRFEDSGEEITTYDFNSEHFDGSRRSYDAGDEVLVTGWK